ncbi:DUF2884 family protein [Colwellia sp. C1TZA3]|uniref:DUF2884 family protein n=1 Tax=Colwellia sp. C1TZA3 TaxID=2508879 RepID=UPI0011B9745F|nr:DUF2884 family protein [Colwellia sp. C1TZA3]TWX73388.1 DUF2884 family protein [Colwellia sp. C1TZA3]
MKTLIATVLIMASSTSYGHDNSFSSESCHVDLNGGINIKAKEITFSKDKLPLYSITSNDTLLINGEEIALTAHQQSLLHNYSTHIRNVVPEVKSIALGAIDLAIDGVNLAFNELLGEGNKASAELTTQLTSIRGEVDAEFTRHENFYIDEEGFSGKDFFGENFEQKIESAVESTIKNALGSLMIAVGQEMLFSGGDMNAFESKMENFGELIEHEMETRSARLEKRGEALCRSIIVIDKMEEQLKESIDEITDYDLITASKKNSIANSKLM